MKKKVLFIAPFLTKCGYYYRARDILDHFLATNEYDISIIPKKWLGDAITDIQLEALYADPEKLKTECWDICISVLPPPEISHINCKLNVCITPGIEADRVIPQWNNRINNEMDLLVVPSNHSKSGFLKQEEPPLSKPVVVNHEGFFDYNKIEPEFVLDNVLGEEKFLLSMGQWIAGADLYNERKQTSLLIHLFFEAFRGREDVSLVLKTYMSQNNLFDFRKIINKISVIKETLGIGKYPRVHLIHGDIDIKKMAGLYKDPRCLGFITTTSGEGWGRHIIDAAAIGLPIITPYWSSMTDYLLEDCTVKLPHSIKPVTPQWLNYNMRAFFNEDSQWAIVDIEKSIPVLQDFVNGKIEINTQKQKEHIFNNFELSSSLIDLEKTILEHYAEKEKKTI